MCCFCGGWLWLSNSAKAWKACHNLAMHEGLTDLQTRKRLLSFAMAHCDRFSLGSLLQVVALYWCGSCSVLEMLMCLSVLLIYDLGLAITRN